MHRRHGRCCRCRVKAARACGVQHLVWSTLPDCNAISEGRFPVRHFSDKRTYRDELSALEQLSPLRASIHLVGGSNREKVPFPWHALESVHAPVIECNVGADDQVLHGA
jgi:NmrA-like family